MKKTLYCLMAVLAVCFSFASCDDDDFSVNRGTHATLPETEIVGTYTGTYSVYKDDGVTLEKTVEGSSVTLAQGENKYTATFVSNSSDASINGPQQQLLNVAWANNDIKFWGPTTISTDVAGYLNATGLNGTYSNGKLTLRFSKTFRSGRKAVTTIYSFEGTK